MKKGVIVLLIIFLIYPLLASNLVYASSAATYFSGQAIKLEDTNDDIEIVSNEILIDTSTSKIKNTFLLNNKSNKEIKTTITIPLENKEISTTIHDLVITINSFEVEYEKENGEYSFKTILNPGEAKKIEIGYFTDNDLKDAKIIKYNLDNFGEKTVGKVKVDIIIPEKDIPLVTGIYPGHYTFDNNTISIEYYNFKANTLTKDIIVEKQTYKNLLYGQEYELKDADKYILENADKLINAGIRINYEQIEHFPLEKMKENWYDDFTGKRYSYYNILEECDNILTYVVYKQILKDNMEQKIFNPYISYEGDREKGYGLVKDLINSSITSYRKFVYLPRYETDKEDTLKNKKICIDYVETEDVDLYVHKAISGKGSEAVYEYIKEDEWKILKTNTATGEPGTSTGDLGAKLIFVGQGLDGQNLNATEEEKIEYINSIGADMYMRIMIYDGILAVGGYYNDSDLEMAREFFKEDESYVDESDFDYYEELKEQYGTYEKFYESYKRNRIVKLSNENVVNKCEVPTIAKFIGRREKKDGKYVVELEDGVSATSSYNGRLSGLISVADTLRTKQAQKLLTANKQKNENIKKETEEKIAKLNFNNNELEIQESLKEKVENVSKDTIRNSNFKLEMMDIAIFSTIGVAIIICIIILIITHNKRKRRM